MAELAERVASLVGQDVLRLSDSGSRWPALGELLVEDEWRPVALYLGLVGLSQRGRDDVERRFQNPGSNRPILEAPGRDLLLLGLWDADPWVDVDRPLLMSADPFHRLGLNTRYSVFARLTMLRAGLESGWAEDESSTGELVRSFSPPLLPLSYAADRLGGAPPTLAVTAAIEGSGLLHTYGEQTFEAAERVRQVGTRLVRDSRFSRRVVAAYGGLCAMCGLDIGLVQGAHIYPVSAPGSYDEPWNGLALCGNHHLAFDRHVLGVRSDTFEIAFHPMILDQVSASPAVASLVAGTFERLEEPGAIEARPRAEMFERRYEFYEASYAWLLA